MPWTVAQVEAELIGFMSPYFRATGIDADTADGTNVALHGPIRYALWYSGFPTAGGPDVTDDDLAALPAGGLERFFDVARLESLLLCMGHWAKVDFTAGGNSQSLSQLFDQWKWWVDFLRRRIAEPVVPGVLPGPGAAAAGLIYAGRCGSPQQLPFECGRSWRGRGAY